MNTEHHCDLSSVPGPLVQWEPADQCVEVSVGAGGVLIRLKISHRGPTLARSHTSPAGEQKIKHKLHSASRPCRFHLSWKDFYPGS